MFLFLLVLTARISMLFLSLFSSSQGAQIARTYRLSWKLILFIHITIEVRIPSVCPTAGQIKCTEIFTSFSRAQNYIQSLSPETQNGCSIALFNSKPQ